MGQTFFFFLLVIVIAGRGTGLRFPPSTLTALGESEGRIAVLLVQYIRTARLRDVINDDFDCEVRIH